MEWVIVAILVFVGLGVAAVRLAPSDAAVWHIDPRTAKDPGDAGVLVRHEIAGKDVLARFDAAIRQEPRLTVLAGSVRDGSVTYIARSRVIGFPDYITVARADGALVILSRLRFGQSDLGVNKARLERVLERL